MRVVPFSRGHFGPARAMKRALLLLLTVGVVAAAWVALRPPPPLPVVYYATDFSEGGDGQVGFPSWNADSVADVLTGGTGMRWTVGGGLLVVPEEATPLDPVPAVVILHGSGGEWSGRGKNYALRLAREAGIAGFAVDTFTSRGLTAADGYFERMRAASIYTQIVDAYMALSALQEHPLIDGSRVAVTGFSLGAASTLYTMFEPVAEAIVGADGPRFSAFASFYSGCSLDFEDFRVAGGPVLLMLGELDESTDPERCRWLANKLDGQGVDARVEVYPGAGHGWNQPYPARFVEGAFNVRDCNTVWTRDGRAIEAASGRNMDSFIGAMLAFRGCAHRRGYTMGYNEAASAQSWQDFVALLGRAWPERAAVAGEAMP